MQKKKKNLYFVHTIKKNQHQKNPTKDIPT
jgi:hypothetical protein